MRAIELLLCLGLASCESDPPPPRYAPITAEEVAAGVPAGREEVVFQQPGKTTAAVPAPPASGNPALLPGVAEIIAQNNLDRARGEEMFAEHDRECAEQRARDAAEAGAGDAAYTASLNARDAHVAWVHDHCSAHQPAPVVTCNPVCVARRACFVWTCAEHPDWAEEVSIYDCDGHRNARAAHIRLPCD